MTVGDLRPAIDHLLDQRLPFGGVMTLVADVGAVGAVTTANVAATANHRVLCSGIGTLSARGD